MRVIVANFGVENHFWPECRKTDIVATFETRDLYRLWETGQRDAFIAKCMRDGKTASGRSVAKNVASRWYEITTIASDSAGDLWLHLATDGLWWTYTKADPPTITLEPPTPKTASGEELLAIRKPAHKWSNLDKKGFRLDRGTLHRKALDILTIQSALQEPSPANAEYIQALIHGSDLSEWENSAKFKKRAPSTGPGRGRVMTPLQVTIQRMAQTAFETVAGANGQQVASIAKIKNMGFDNEMELRDHLQFLWIEQAGICAISGLALGVDYEQQDSNLLASLDRIDSNGHYERNNLQLVCRFINRWKGAADDSEFRRLMDLVRTA